MRHHCLQLQLIAERPKVLKLSKRGLEWQGRPSRGTPTPPGYGYLTRHLPRRATHTWLSGSASRQASPSARNEEETRLHAQIPRCSGLDSHNEQTPTLRVPLQTELRFHSRGYELPPHQRVCGTTNSRWLAGDRCTSSDNDLRLGWLNSSNDDLRANAAVGRPSPTSPHEGRGQAVKAEEPEVRPQVAPTVSSAKPSLAATTSAPTTAATCPPMSHQRAMVAPKRTGRSSLPFSPRERERDRPRTRVPPSRRTTCCAADGAGRTWTWSARTRRNRHPCGRRAAALRPSGGRWHRKQRQSRSDRGARHKAVASSTDGERPSPPITEGRSGPRPTRRQAPTCPALLPSKDDEDP
jgi:hypothetical protein